MTTRNPVLAAADHEEWAGTHLRYEGVLFFLVAEQFFNWSYNAAFAPDVAPDLAAASDWATFNAALEVFAVKMRLLSDFFFDPPGFVRDDDVLATDLAPAWAATRGSMPASIASVRTAANKSAAHMNPRAAAVEWDIGLIAEDLAVIFEQFHAAHTPSATAASEIGEAIARFRRARTRLQAAVTRIPTGSTSPLLTFAASGTVPTVAAPPL